MRAALLIIALLACGGLSLRVGAGQVVSVSGSTPAATVQLNVDIIQTLAASAVALNASIVAFPEFALMGNFNFDSCVSPSDLSAYAEPLTTPGGAITCGDGSPMAQIGCSAAAQKLYVSYNTVEAAVDGSYYNTQAIVHNGRLVARYRKYNVFYKKCFTSPALELVTFEVQNVTFGVFTCYDIMFDHPKQDLVAAGVKYFSYSSAIPIIGTDAVKLFSAINQVNVVSSDADAGQSAVINKGLTLVRAGSSAGNVVVVASM